MKTQFPTLAALLLSALLTSGLLTSKSYAQDDGDDAPADSPSTEPVTDADPDSDTNENTDPSLDPDSPLPQNTTPGKLKVQISGTAIGNNDTALQITPPLFDTGLIEIGESVSQTVVITHGGAVGDEAITINEAQLFGANPDEFTVDFSGFVTLLPGDEIPVQVTFTPAFPGEKLAGLRLSVEGLTAPVVLQFEGVTRFPLTSELLIADDDVSFGTTNAGNNTTKQITLTNDGEPTAPVVNISNLQISGQSANAFSTNFTQTALSPGESISFNVTLSGNETGFKQAELEITHDGNNDEIVVNVQGNKIVPGDIVPEFDSSKLKGVNITKGTSLQFGPDGKLYVTEIDGFIKIYNVNRAGKNNYNANLETTITSVAATQNHDDSGNPVNLGNKRLVTGIAVVGTAAAPIIYVASSDPRQAAGPSGKDANLDTNSGILHRLTKNGNNWIKKDLVRGLPRSEENHIPNGIVVKGNTLFLVTGGHTNEGAPSNNFALHVRSANTGR